MVNQSAPDSDSETRDEAPNTPRWVKVLGIVGIIVVLLFAILHLAGGGLGEH